MKRNLLLVAALLTLLIGVPVAWALVTAPAQGSAPTFVANGGTNASVIGRDDVFLVTLGTSPGNPFVLKFAGTWGPSASPPVCVAQNQFRADIAHPVEVAEVETFRNNFGAEVEIILAVANMTGGGGNGNPAAAVAGDKYSVLCFR